jgi:hypothetical protein
MFRDCVLLLLSPVLVKAQTVTVTGGAKDAADVVVVVDGKPVKVLPTLKAGEVVKINAAEKPADPAAFAFKEAPGEYVDVLDGTRPVVRFVNKPRDKDNHYPTFKPFHQLFDPTKGEIIVNSGTSATAKDAQFPHHRGLFFGFNKTGFGDVWHGKNNAYSSADPKMATEITPVSASHTAKIAWHGEDGKAFANEERTVIVYKAPGGTLLDWKTTLTTELPKVRLDGDPQHAGFHFRANHEVSKTNKQTYYVRPDGVGKPGETRNWTPGTKDTSTVNLPWDACSFVVAGKRFTALRIVGADNPKDTRGSERDYGRFGDYFEYDLTPSTPLKLSYRIWLQEGEMTVEECAAIAEGFRNPPKVEVTK